MPKETFLHLPQEKRTAFLKAALQEFALHPYAQASITRIVKKLGIAKGSVYQYFENKSALYSYLWQTAAEKKQAYLQKALAQHATQEFWWVLEQLYVAGIRFDLECPLHSSFLYTASQERNPPQGEDFALRNKQQGLQMMEQFLATAQAEGRVRLRTDMPLRDVAYFLVQVSLGIADYLKLFHKVDYEANIKVGKPVYGLSEQQIMHTAQLLIRFMRSGAEG